MRSEVNLEAKCATCLDDFNRAAALRNLTNPHMPMLGEELLRNSKDFPFDKKSLRSLITIEGLDVAYLSIIESYWSEEVDEFSININVNPLTITPELFEQLFKMAIEKVVELGGITVSYWIESVHKIFENCALAHGFVPGQINPMTRLELSKFDFEKWSSSAIIPAGYTLVSGDQVKIDFPDDWKNMFWRFVMDSLADVPSPSPFVEVPFEQFEKSLVGPFAHLTDFIFAMADGEIASGSAVEQFAADPQVGHIQLVGTMQKHRRKGLAKALKILAVKKAQEKGIQFIYTDNEEKNPLLHVNIDLGYKLVSNYVHYTKHLA